MAKNVLLLNRRINIIKRIKRLIKYYVFNSLHLFYKYNNTIESDVDNMTKKVFQFIFLTLCLMFIFLAPVSASNQFKVTITEVTNSGEGATSNYSSYTDNSVTFAADLYLPGDYITYKIKVKNQGNIDAILKKINVEKTDNPAILFDYKGINEGDILKKGDEVTFTVTASYNNNITTQPQDVSGKIKITLDYEQNGNFAIDDSSVGGAGTGDTVDIFGVSVPNTVAYASIWGIIIGLLLIIIAIIVIKKTVFNKKNEPATSSNALENNVEVLDLDSESDIVKDK